MERGDTTPASPIPLMLAIVAAVVALGRPVSPPAWPAPPPYSIRVQWLNLGISLIVIPLIVMVGAGVLTRSRLPSERRAN